MLTLIPFGQAIAIHTFSFVWFGKGAESGWIAIIGVMAAWLYVLIFNVALVATHKNKASVYTPTPVSTNL
jgi:hypothetical protein